MLRDAPKSVVDVVHPSGTRSAQMHHLKVGQTAVLLAVELYALRRRGLGHGNERVQKVLAITGVELAELAADVVRVERVRQGRQVPRLELALDLHLVAARGRKRDHNFVGLGRDRFRLAAWAPPRRRRQSLRVVPDSSSCEVRALEVAIVEKVL